MKENKTLAFIKANFVWLLTLLVLVVTLFGLLGPIVSAKGVSVEAADGWFNVSKITGRSEVTLFKMIEQSTWQPITILYCLVLVGIILVALGKFVHHNFYIGATLLLLCNGIFFLTSNTFYDLALCNSLANEPNLFEELHAVSEAKLAFGATFSSITCFAGALLSYACANEKDSLNVNEMSEIAIFSALAIGLQFIKIQIGATGGSINLGLVPLFIIALRHGPTKGFIASAFVFGLITCITDGYGFNTYPFDYLLGFGGVAALGFFKKYCFQNNEKGYSNLGFLYIAMGVLIATLVRFIGGTASSMINYGYKFAAACEYNVIYVFVTGGVSLAAMELLFIPLAKVNKMFPLKKN